VSIRDFNMDVYLANANGTGQAQVTMDERCFR
jgi:hypothetical protein